MKTTRPAGFTPEEWATLRNAIDVDEEGMIHPKKKDGTGSSKDATTARKYKGQRSEREKNKGNAQRTMGWRQMDVQLGHTEEHKQGQERS